MKTAVYKALSRLCHPFLVIGVVYSGCVVLCCFEFESTEAYDVYNVIVIHPSEDKRVYHSEA